MQNCRTFTPLTSEEPVCCLGVLSVHHPNPNWWFVVGAWWTTLALLGIATFFLSIAVGTLLGVDEERAGLLAWPLIGMASDIITMTPTILTLGVGVTRARILPWLGITAVWVAAPVLPIGTIAGELTGGTAETVDLSTVMTLFVGAWTVLGIALVRTEATRARPQRSDT